MANSYTLHAPTGTEYNEWVTKMPIRTIDKARLLAVELLKNKSYSFHEVIIADGNIFDYYYNGSWHKIGMPLRNLKSLQISNYFGKVYWSQPDFRFMYRSKDNKKYYLDYKTGKIKSAQ